MRLCKYSVTYRVRSDDGMVQVQPSSTSKTIAPRACVWVCQHRSCSQRRSPQVLDAFRKAVPESIDVEPSGCMGQCSSGPTVRVTPDETWYWQVQPEDVPTIVEQHLKGGEPVDEKLNSRIHLRF